MRSSTFSLIAALISVASCGTYQDQSSVKLQFSPAAFFSDEFSTGPTNVTSLEGCAIPDNIATLEVQAFAATLTRPSTLIYDVSDIDADCALNIFVPPGGSAEIVVKAFDSDDSLVRKGTALLPPLLPGESIDFPAPLWPAKRMNDTAGGDGSPTNLVYIEVMRQFDQFLIELAFDSVVYPATKGSPDALYGYINLRNTESGDRYSAVLDAASTGLTVFNIDRQTIAQAHFQFIVGGLQIALPYVAVGGEDGTATGIVSAPELEFSLTLHDSQDVVVDRFPELDEDVATLN